MHLCAALAAREVYLVLPLLQKLNALEARVADLGTPVSNLSPCTHQDVQVDALREADAPQGLPSLSIGLLMIVSTTYSSILAASPFADHTSVRVLLVSLPPFPPFGSGYERTYCSPPWSGWR